MIKRCLVWSKVLLNRAAGEKQTAKERYAEMRFLLFSGNCKMSSLQKKFRLSAIHEIIIYVHATTRDARMLFSTFEKKQFIHNCHSKTTRAKNLLF